MCSLESATKVNPFAIIWETWLYSRYIVCYTTPVCTRLTTLEHRSMLVKSLMLCTWILVKSSTLSFIVDCSQVVLIRYWWSSALVVQRLPHVKVSMCTCRWCALLVAPGDFWFPQGSLLGPSSSYSTLMIYPKLSTVILPAPFLLTVLNTHVWSPTYLNAKLCNLIWTVYMIGLSSGAYPLILKKIWSFKSVFYPISCWQTLHYRWQFTYCDGLGKGSWGPSEQQSHVEFECLHSFSQSQ